MKALEVGDMVGPNQRIVSLRWLKSRGWKATDSTGARYYQTGPGHGSRGPSFALGLETTRGLAVWPPVPEGAKPKRRLQAVSPTNKRWNAPGRARPDEPLATWCEVAIEGVCTGRATDRHHIIPRGPGSSDDKSNTLDVCGDGCHKFIHAHPEWSHEHGYLKHRPNTRAMGVFTLASVALTAAVCAVLLALGGCAEGDAGQVCRLPDAADCDSHIGGENGDNP